MIEGRPQLLEDLRTGFSVIGEEIFRSRYGAYPTLIKGLGELRDYALALEAERDEARAEAKKLEDGAVRFRDAYMSFLSTLRAHLAEKEAARKARGGTE